MAEKKGYLAFVFHGHIPYVVRKGTWPHGLVWLQEAASDSYLRTLNMLHELIDEGYHPHFTLNLSPVLVEQLRDPEFVESLEKYLQMMADSALSDAEIFRKWGDKHLEYLANLWHKEYSKLKEDFIHRYNRDIVGAFKKLQDDGYIEIITCAATHGYLPLLGNDENVRAQVKIGVETYKKHFGRQPLGIWLPECAYRPRYKWKRPIGKPLEFERAGIEEILADYGLNYFIVDTHLLLGGEAAGVYAARFPLLKEMWERFKQQYKPKPLPPNFDKDPYVPYLVGSKEKNTAFFTRDEKTGLLVWSKDWGYPGDYNYREFHKRFENSGHRYWRITGAKVDLAYKEPYVPEWAQQRVREHADHFARTVHGIIEDHWNSKHIPGVVVAAYDFELIGGWFYEGVDWLKGVLKRVEDDPEVDNITLGAFLAKHPPEVIVSLPEGSWGQGGGHWVWLNEWTTWCWQRIYECEDSMKELASKYAEGDEEFKRILKQMARELLLLESSDWEFLITTWSARDYAENRVAQHYEWYKRLEKMAIKKLNGESLTQHELAFLSDVERIDNLFADIDPRIFAG